MKNVHIINSATPFLHAKGELGAMLCDEASLILNNKGFNVTRVDIHKGYDIDEEIERLLNANYWLFQIPGWWMGCPWTLKKYIDEVFTYSKGKLYVNDGRSRNDTSKKYGDGGLSQDKYYMLSWSWNLPKSAFNDDGFFKGKNIDDLSIGLHKTFEFLGMKAMPTFMCNDVIKNLNIDELKSNFKEHILNNF